MAPRKLRKALGGLKDQTSISIAKVGGTKAPDLDVAIVKATSHDDFFDDRYAQEILHLTSYSRGYVNACVASLAKRIRKTHDWNVALKSLVLIHRLLRDGDPNFEDELMRASRNGMRILNLSHFRDDTHANAWDYSAFVRTYGLYLDERLDCSVSVSGNNDRRAGRGGRRSAYSRSPVRSSHRRSPGVGSKSRYGRSPDSGYTYSDDRRHSNYDGGLSPRYGDRSGRTSGRDDWSDRTGRNDRFDGEKEEDTENVPIKEMSAKQLLEKLPAMQMLMERVLGCRPTGAAKTNRLVQLALYPVVKESIQLYKDICDGMAILLEAFFDMEQPDRVKAYDLYHRSAKQGDELEGFYKVCKHYGVGRSSDYITIEPVSKEHLDSLEDFLRSNAPSQSRRSKSPEPQPLQLEYRPQTPVRQPEPEARPITPAPAPVVAEVPKEASRGLEPEPAPEPEGDLLDFGKATISPEEQGDKLALALFSGTTTNGTWVPFSSAVEQDTSLQQGASEQGKAGWELALVASVSNLSKPNNAPMAGGFNPLLLDSMYDQGAVLQKQAAAAVPAGSASSVAIPNRPASSFLALPAPPGGMPLPVTGEDPFAASATVPPPPYVQMADLTTKQELLTQERAMWQRYQRDGMRGEAGFMKLYNNPYAGMAPQSSLALPYYNVGMPVANHYAPY